MKKNYWITIICCFLIQAATIGIYCNCTGLFTSQILNEFGFSNGSFSLSLTLRTLTTAITMMFVAKIYNKNNYKKLYCLLGLLAAILWAIQIVFTELWMWYLENLLLGLVLGLLLTVPLNIILKNWFHTRLGFALGIAMTASGVCGMLINPISSSICTSYGWRYGVILLSIISSCILIPCSLFILKWEPEQIGLEPYQEKDKNKEKVNKEITKKNSQVTIISILSVIFLYCLTQYLNSISVYVNSLGMSVTFAGFAISALMIGNLSGKIIIGVIADLLGTFKTLILNLISVTVSFFIFIFFNQPIFIVLACFFYGTSLSLCSLSPGLLTNECITKEMNANILGKMNSYGTFAGAIFYLFISYSFDLFGNFNISFYISIIICLLSIGFIIYLEQKQKELY